VKGISAFCLNENPLKSSPFSVEVWRVSVYDTTFAVVCMSERLTGTSVCTVSECMHRKKVVSKPPGPIAVSVALGQTQAYAAISQIRGECITW